MAKVLVLSTECGDWEGLYLNGNLMYERHNSNTEDRLFFLRFAETYLVTSEDFHFGYLDMEDDYEVGMNGRFPERLDMFIGDYEY